MSDALLGGAGEVSLTELSNEALLKLVALDLNAVIGNESVGYYGGYGEWAPYVSVAERRRDAANTVAKLRKKDKTIAPVTIEGSRIATSFWGKAWCDNLESYRDYAYRLERGRSYVRHGAVVDLKIAPGEIAALVNGSALYRTKVTVAPTPPAKWRAICADCTGRIEFAGGTAPGAVLQAGDGAAVQPGQRPVPAPVGDQVHLQLPRPCLDVQARRGGAVWHRRAARPEPRAVVPAARGGRDRAARRFCRGAAGGAGRR